MDTEKPIFETQEEKLEELRTDLHKSKGHAEQVKEKAREKILALKNQNEMLYAILKKIKEITDEDIPAEDRVTKIRGGVSKAIKKLESEDGDV